MAIMLVVLAYLLCGFAMITVMAKRTEYPPDDFGNMIFWPVVLVVLLWIKADDTVANYVAYLRRNHHADQ